MGDAMGEHIGLAGSGARDDQQWGWTVSFANAVFDGGALSFVQFAQGRGDKRRGDKRRGWRRGANQG
jgi:hypothetical protein